MDLKALNAYSLERVEKGQLYEVYNHCWNKIRLTDTTLRAGEIVRTNNV